jgi:hypothetical protein
MANKNATATAATPDVPEVLVPEVPVDTSVRPDETIPGGRYYNTAGRLINAEGKRIHPDGSVLTPDELAAE